MLTGKSGTLTGTAGTFRLAPAEKGRIRTERGKIGKENTMNALYIEGRRSGYSPDGCGKTLTVGELIEILSDFDEDLPVYLRNDNGYTYGNITERTIIPSEDLEEGDDE